MFQAMLQLHDFCPLKTKSYTKVLLPINGKEYPGVRISVGGHQFIIDVDPKIADELDGREITITSKRKEIIRDNTHYLIHKYEISL